MIRYLFSQIKAGINKIGNIFHSKPESGNELKVTTGIGAKITRSHDSAIQKTRGEFKDKAKFTELLSEYSSIYYPDAILISKNPNSKDIDTKAVLKRQKNALEIAKKLVEMEPLRGVPWMCLSRSNLILGNYSEAIHAGMKAIHIDPTDPEKWDLVGKIHEISGNKVKAQEHFKMAKDIRDGTYTKK